MTYHFHHFGIIKVIDDVLKNVAIRHEAKGSEHNDDGNFLLYVWQDGNNTLTDRTFSCTLKYTIHNSSLRITQTSHPLITAFLSNNSFVPRGFTVYI